MPQSGQLKVACVAGVKRGAEGEGGREKSVKDGKREGSYPLSPIPFSFSLPPYPLSTPATQAKIKVKGTITRKSMLF